MPAGEAIERLLAGQYPDPETGAPLGTTVRAVAIDDDLDGREVELVAGLGLGPRLAVVCDGDTAIALGDRVTRALASRYQIQAVRLDRHPHADEATLERLIAVLEPGLDAIVTVGSGTLNDLCKLAGLRRGCAHVVFGTAPSMNGYASGYASLMVGGLKRSLRAPPPIGVFLDVRVLAAAPVRLIRSGLGDSLCRSTAQADWLLAHLLLDQPYREAPFALLAGDEPALLAGTAALVAGDLEAVTALARTLILSGFGMSICGGSYPASQGEHLISHYLDMMRPAGVPDALHGEQIGVATLTMARLQAGLLARARPPVVGPSTISHAGVLAEFGPDLGAACWSELAPKRLDQDGADRLNARLARDWDAIRTRIGAVSLAPARLEAALAAAGAPTGPAALGCPPWFFDRAVQHARAIRNRYTFLDLAAELRT